GGNRGADPVLPGIDGARPGTQPDRRAVAGESEGSDSHGLACPVDADDADADPADRVPGAGESWRGETGNAESGSGKPSGDDESGSAEPDNALADVHVSLLDRGQAHPVLVVA